MINKIFVYDNATNKVLLNVPEILLVKEFKALLDYDRNKCKLDPKGILGLRAFREFTYIWLAIDWCSIYSDYDELDRHREAMSDAQITLKEFDDELFRAACRKYKEIQQANRSIRMLNAALTTIDKFIDYFTTIVDFTERDLNGKPIFTGKNVADEISRLSKVHQELVILEGLVKKQVEESSLLRGGAIEGYIPKS